MNRVPRTEAPEQPPTSRIPAAYWPPPLVLRDDELQLLTMALAHLAVERPGWEDMIRRLTTDRLGVDASLLDRLKALHEAHIRQPYEAADSIMQLRAVVERANPLLWAMVREIAWPE